MSRDFAPLAEDWVFSGQKHGWVLRLKHKRRALLYLKPMEQYFRVSLALGPRAVQAVRASSLPKRVVRLIDEAVVYPEGKAIRIDVRGPSDIRVATRLAAIKLET